MEVVGNLETKKKKKHFKDKEQESEFQKKEDLEKLGLRDTRTGHHM